MAKQNRSSQSVQPPAARPAAQEEKPPEAPAWGVAILLWVLCFGGLCAYELWIGVLGPALRR